MGDILSRRPGLSPRNAPGRCRKLSSGIPAAGRGPRERLRRGGFLQYRRCRPIPGLRVAASALEAAGFTHPPASDEPCMARPRRRYRPPRHLRRRVFAERVVEAVAAAIHPFHVEAQMASLAAAPEPAERNHDPGEGRRRRLEMDEKLVAGEQRLLADGADGGPVPVGDAEDREGDPALVERDGRQMRAPDDPDRIAPDAADQRRQQRRHRQRRPRLGGRQAVEQQRQQRERHQPRGRRQRDIGRPVVVDRHGLRL